MKAWSPERKEEPNSIVKTPVRNKKAQKEKRVLKRLYVTVEDARRKLMADYKEQAYKNKIFEQR